MPHDRRPAPKEDDAEEDEEEEEEDEEEQDDQDEEDETESESPAQPPARKQTTNKRPSRDYKSYLPVFSQHNLRFA